MTAPIISAEPQQIYFRNPAPGVLEQVLMRSDEIPEIFPINRQRARAMALAIIGALVTWPEGSDS